MENIQKDVKQAKMLFWFLILDIILIAFDLGMREGFAWLLTITIICIFYYLLFYYRHVITFPKESPAEILLENIENMMGIPFKIIFPFLVGIFGCIFIMLIGNFISKTIIPIIEAYYMIAGCIVLIFFSFISYRLLRKYRWKESEISEKYERLRAEVAE